RAAYRRWSAVHFDGTHRRGAVANLFREPGKIVVHDPDDVEPGGRKAPARKGGVKSERTEDGEQRTENRKQRTGHRPALFSFLCPLFSVLCPPFSFLFSL